MATPCPAPPRRRRPCLAYCPRSRNESACAALAALAAGAINACSSLAATKHNLTLPPLAEPRRGPPNQPISGLHKSARGLGSAARRPALGAPAGVRTAVGPSVAPPHRVGRPARRLCGKGFSRIVSTASTASTQAGGRTGRTRRDGRCGRPGRRGQALGRAEAGGGPSRPSPAARGGVV